MAQTHSVPSYGGVPLVDDTEKPVSGAAFELANAPRRDASAHVDGWTIEARTGMKTIIVRGGHETDYDSAWRRALMQAQKGLDFLSILWHENLSIVRVTDQHVTWWGEPDGLVVRVVSLTTTHIDVPPVNAVVQDSEGNVVPSSNAQQPSWHESFRYFRLSQTSEDLFDAYRNAFLALESTLSDIAPQTSGEGEGQWFHRALGEANNIVSLNWMVPPGADPVTYLYSELYQNTRSAMSHAKRGRRVLLPRNEDERQNILSNLGLVVRTYLNLADAHLGVRPRGGFMFAVAFRSMTRPCFEGGAIEASDDETPLDPSDVVANPAGGKLVPLLKENPVDTSESFLTEKLSWARTWDLAELPFIRRLVAIDSEGTPVMADVLEGRLILGIAVRLEALLGIRGLNVRQPRDHYAF